MKFVRIAICQCGKGEGGGEGRWQSTSLSPFQLFNFETSATLRAGYANPPAGATGPILSANNGNQMPELPHPRHIPSALFRMPYSNALLQI